jgi:hypothetical protein
VGDLIKNFTEDNNFWHGSIFLKNMQLADNKKDLNMQEI